MKNSIQKKTEPQNNKDVNLDLEKKEKEIDNSKEEKKEIPEKECIDLTKENIKDSVSEDWDIDKEKGVAETKEAVELGVKYIFPLEEKTTVTFSCLPGNLEDRSILKIEKINKEEVNLTENLQIVGDYVFDITTEMENGDFEYDLTLPIIENLSDKDDLKTFYVEDKKDLKDKNQTKEIEKENIQIDKDKNELKVEKLDHFTVFLTVVEWNFPNNPDDAVADGGVSANLSKEIIGVGVESVTFDQSGDDGTKAARAIGWENGVNTKYWQIEFDTSGYENIALSSKQRSSAKGPKDFKLQFRIGADTSWTDISGGEITVGNNWITGVVENLQLPEETDDTSLVFVRWVVKSTVSVGEGVVESAGSNFIDNIVVKGTKINTVPIANSGAFTVAEGSLHNGEVSGTDVDGDLLSFYLANGPTYGTLTFNGDGSFRYTAHRQPKVGFSGIDSFNFKASDGELSSESATVNITITPVNDAPVAYSDSFTVNAGESHSGYVTGTDIDGDTPTFVLWADPHHGDVSHINSDGSFTYTADLDYSGEDFFYFKAYDGMAYSDPTIISITVIGLADETAPSFDFVEPTPSDGGWINYNDPIIKIEANEELSGAYLDMFLGNGGFENGLVGYDTTSSPITWQHNNNHRGGLYSATASGYNYYNNTSTHLGRTITFVEDGVLSFWMKADTEENKDFLIFTVNGEEKARISGNVDWTETIIPLSAGTNELRWTYEKDATGHAGADSVWIDDVKVIYGFEGEGLAMTIDSNNKKIASYQLSDLLDIENQYRVTAYDLVGNKTESMIKTFKVDTVVPTGYVYISPYEHNKETSGIANFSVSLQEGGSYLKDVCLWLGDEEDNLLPEDYDNCKNLNERGSNSYDYAPDFGFDAWDTTTVEDGEYNLYAIATDNAGNVERIKLNGGFKINNYSEGSSQNPSEISTCAEFQAIDNNLNWHYKFINDIDCLETKNWNGDRGFLGIGDGDSFSGVVDGQNFTVSNLYQSDTSENSGIFNYTSGKVVNLNFRNVDIVCHSTYCGAFTAFNWGTIEKSSITGKLQCSGQCGGFASQHSGLITQSWVGMTILGNNGYASGFVGISSNGVVQQSYFRGHLDTDNGGGITGLNSGWNGVGVVDTSYAANTFTPKETVFSGGLIGWQYVGDQIRSYWDAELSQLDVMCGQNGTNCQNEHGLTTAQMKDSSSFVGWDFENIWAIDPEKNDGYPYLQWQTSFSEKDETAPVITLLGDAIVEIEVGDTYIDAGATATDNVDGDITEDIVVFNPVDENIIGTYKVTYNVDDTSGNSAVEVTRTVNVVKKNYSY